MKLMIVSHTFNVESNKKVFKILEQYPAWDIIYITPKVWNSEYKNQIGNDSSHTKYLKVFFNGSVPLHFYHISLIKTIIDEKPDVIYSHNEPYALSTFQLFLIGKIFRVATLVFYSAQNIYKKNPLPFYLFERMVYKIAIAAFPITREVADVLIHKGFKGKISIIPLTIDVKNFVPSIKAEGIFKIGYVGRLTGEKGLMTLLQSMNLLKEFNWQLDIVGEGPLRAEMLSYVRQNKIESRVNFLGFIPHTDANQIIAGLDVLVLPSETRKNWKEQFGRVLLEAAACEVAIIGSDSGEIPRLVEKIGGLVFKEANPASLAECIKTLISNREFCKKIGKEGREVIEKYFSDDIAAEYYDKYLKEAVDQNKNVRNLEIDAKKNLTISIIVPTYRRSEDLRRTLNSMESQIIKPKEVIVVRRLGDDESAKVIKSFLNRINLIEVVVDNPGVVYAMNSGILSSTANVTGIIDDDVELSEDWTARIISNYAIDAKVGAVGGRDDVVAEDEVPDRRIVGRVSWYGKVYGDHHLGFGHPREVDTLKGVNSSYKTEFIKLLGFDTRLLGSGAQTHYEISIANKIKKLGYKIIYDPNIILKHYASVRHDEDQRRKFNEVAYYNSNYNLFKVVINDMGISKRLFATIFYGILGTRSEIGVLQYLRLKNKDVHAGRKLRLTLSALRDIYKERWQERMSGHV